MALLPELPAGGVVLGVGIDLVEVERVERALGRHGEAFRRRVFTAEEQAYCDGMRKPFPHFAARFAAKEAVSKAFGTGIGEFLGWKSVGVSRHSSGAPFVTFDDLGRNLLEARGARDVLLSLSHTDCHATAIAILVQ